MFNKSNAIALIEASEANPFPVNFDDAWQWLGYSTKANAKRLLVSGQFISGTDFIIRDEATTTGISAIPLEIITLSVECFKLLAMLSGTEKGKQVRMYFLECEKIAKAAAKPMTPAQQFLFLAQQAVEQEQKLINHDNRLEAIEYHTSGYEDYYTLKAFCNIHKVDMAKFNPSSEAKKIVKLCSELGLETKKIADSKYGEVNAYPTEALKIHFAK
jgi:phage anti-repressor protein